MKLDLNRGVVTRFHRSGVKVSMYRDTPGEYYTEDGKRIDARFAREAGFDVERDMREKVKNERLAAYKAQLESEMRSEEDALAQVASNRSAYDVRHVGAGQYAVFDKEGKRLTRVAMTKADLEMLIGASVDADPNDPSAESKLTPEVEQLLGPNPAAVQS